MKQIKKHEILHLTLLSGLIGAIVFIMIYGVEVLNVTKDGWLNTTGDITQHYYGWCAFKNADWTFPIGLFNSLSYPTYTSIIFTDSIPIFAVIFKIFSGLLPETFQYFGLFGIMTYILQGVFAYTLLRKFISNKYVFILGTIFFIISPYILQRMYGHTSLSAHFIILAGLCIWAYREKYKGNLKKKILLWSLLLAMGTMIHMYFIPMTVIIMLSTFVTEFIEDKKTYKSSILTFVISCCISLMIIFLFGGGLASDVHAFGADTYNTNLNTFFNPQGYSKFLLNLNTATAGENEAFGYLGFGMLLMSFVSCILITKNYTFKEFIDLLKRPNTVFIIVCTLISIIVSIGTSVKIQSHILFNIPYPGFILRLFEIFRATGRFIWIACYIIFFVNIYIISRYFDKKKIINVVITVCLVIQIVDLYPSLKSKFEYNESDFGLTVSAWDKITENCEHIVCLPNSEYSFGELYRMAFVAKRNDCTMNSFCISRGINDIEKTEKEYLEKLSKGILDDKTLYIIKDEKKEISINSVFNCYRIDDTMVVTSKNIEGLEKFKIF